MLFHKIIKIGKKYMRFIISQCGNAWQLLPLFSSADIVRLVIKCDLTRSPISNKLNFRISY